MKTKAVRMYGADDLRLEEFELPELKDDEILMKVVCDSVCMSTYKSSKKGTEHYLVNDDIGTNPSIIGHEFSGQLVEVGARWADKYKVGESYTVQVALKDLDHGIAGYSMANCGGAATYVILHRAFMEQDNLLRFSSDFGYFSGSMAEPVSCSIHAMRSMYHTVHGTYEHRMGIAENGIKGLFAACGPMGLGGLGYILNCDRRTRVLVVTDIDSDRLAHAEKIFSPDYAAERGVELHYVNTASLEDPVETLMELTGGFGFTDISVYAPVRPVLELADAVLSYDGCLNFFAGPIQTDLKAEMNFFNVHYKSTHVVGTSGGTTDNMREYLAMVSDGKLAPSFMISHIGGINATADTTTRLTEIPGAKKLIYNHIEMELTAIDDFAEKGKTDPLFAELADIVAKNNGLWSVEAETYLLEQKAAA